MVKIAVLMSTYNGEKFIKEQLNSIFKQSVQNVEILIRDDGSTDGTCNILEYFRNEKKINWYAGNNLKPAKSFLDLFYKAGEADYYSFCDQDDIWVKDKLAIAIDKLSVIPSSTPALYFSEKRIVDKELNYIKDTSGKYLLTLEEAFINNPATGCTMVINKRLHDIITTAKIPNYITLHDSWIYRICLAVGGKVIYDAFPHILYRQHEGNVVGYIGIFTRMTLLFKNIMHNNACERSKIASEILNNYYSYIPIDNRDLLRQLSTYRTSLFTKLKLLFNFKMRTGSRVGWLTFRLYIFLNKY